MPQKQVINGKAFEYSVAIKLLEYSGSKLVEDEFYAKTEECYNMLTSQEQTNMFAHAQTMAKHIIWKDPNLRNGEISINSDSAGKKGDVRDVLLKLGNKTVGFSCKNNHEALKHSRLSYKIDFVKDWGLGEKCSQTYWDSIMPVFNDIKNKIETSNKTAKWKTAYDTKTIGKLVYWPILDAWENELRRIYEANPKETVENLMAYIVGKHDFYKIIRQEKAKSVKLQVWNFHKTLPYRKTKYPNAIRSISNFNGSQYSKTICFNQGYTINFRIHSGDGALVQSLKFDIGAIGLPTTIHQQEIEVKE